MILKKKSGKNGPVNNASGIKHNKILEILKTLDILYKKLFIYFFVYKFRTDVQKRER